MVERYAVKSDAYIAWALSSVWTGRCQQLVMRPTITLRLDDDYAEIFRGVSAAAAARMFGGEVPE